MPLKGGIVRNDVHDKEYHDVDPELEDDKAEEGLDDYAADGQVSGGLGYTRWMLGVGSKGWIKT